MLSIVIISLIISGSVNGLFLTREVVKVIKKRRSDYYKLNTYLNEVVLEHEI